MRDSVLRPLFTVVSLFIAACGGSGATDPELKAPLLAQSPSFTSKSGKLHIRVKAREIDGQINGVTYKKMLIYEENLVDDEGTATSGTTSNYIAPAWRIQPGDVVTVDYINELPNYSFTDIEHGPMSLPQPVNLHTHGVTVSPAGNADNILLSIPPMRSNRFTFAIPTQQHHGLYWYHPHIHGLTDDQVYGGLAGHIVIGRADGDYQEFNGLDVHEMMIRYNVERTGTAGELIDASAVDVHGTAHVRDGGDMIYTVNGLSNPKVRVNAARDGKPAESQIWAFTNVTGSASYILGLEEIDTAQALDPAAVGTPLDFVIVSVDGSPLPAPVVLRGDTAKGGYHLPQGGRVAILVQGASASGRTVRLMNLQNRSGSGEKTAYDWANQKYIGGYRDYTRDVLLLSYSDTAVTTKHVDVPTVLTPNYAVAVKTVEGTVENSRTFLFNEVATPSATKPNEFPINDELFPFNRVDQPKAGTVEEWTLLNDSGLTHPFHFHTQYGQVTQIVAPKNSTYDPNFIPSKTKTNTPYPTLQYTTDMTSLSPAQFTQDVVGMPPAEVGADGMPLLTGNRATNPGKVVMRLTFLDYLGTYVEHCHRLPHEDRGMMSLVRTIPHDPIVVTAAKGATSTVTVLRSSDGSKVGPFTPFENFTGDLSVAVGDVDGDAIPDVAVASGGGRATGVVVYSGASAWSTRLFAAELAPSGAPTSGGHVALGDLNGDNHDDIILGEAGGASRVVIFDGVSGARLSEFKPYETNFTGGVEVAAGMVEEGGRISFFTAPGAGRAADVYMYNVDILGDAMGNIPEIHTTLTPVKVAQINGPVGYTDGLSIATGYPFVAKGGFAALFTAPLLGAVTVRAYTIAATGHAHGAGISASGVHVAVAYDAAAARTATQVGTGTVLPNFTSGARIGLFSTTYGAVLLVAQPSGPLLSKWDTNGTSDGFMINGSLDVKGYAVAGM